MALETPTWLNQCYTEKILRKSEGDNSIQVIDVFTKPATAKGDNYTSDMMRISVKFSRDQDGHKITEKKLVIVKISPLDEGTRQNFYNNSGIFDVEVSMMTDTLEKMNKLLGPKHRLSGKVLYVQNEHPKLIAIEDLACLGFRMANRMSGLDLSHTMLALHTLARFHASSVAVCEKEPKRKEMYKRGLFSLDYPDDDIKTFFTMNVKYLAEEVANWPGMKKYSDKIAKLTDHINEIGLDAKKFCENEFNVINHGDFWINNMLFKYDNDDKPIGNICVDFQLSVYTSPAIDLNYFFNTSPSQDIIESKKDMLLIEYLGMMSATMKQLDCKTEPPTMEKLKASLKQRASYGMIASFSILPIVMCSETEAKDLSDLMSNDNFSQPGMKSESYKKVMMKRLPMYDEWGLLDL